MPSHVHLIFRSQENEPGKILGNLKTFTSKALQKEVLEFMGESRKEWMLWMFRQAGLRNSNVKIMQLWQQESHPIELCCPVVLKQKMEYIHMNPVLAGFVEEAHYWKHSSAIDYNGGKGMLKLIKI
jgi:REP element-mobilizing transposase RayT